MQIIISHLNLDFDGLASMVAATKIYPQAKIVLPEKLSGPVQEFLSLYKDVLPLFDKSFISPSEIERVIIVDTNSGERLGELIHKIKDAEKIIWDHHPETEDSILSSEKHIESIGATVTLLVEQLIKKNIPLTSFEATILALGIYSDTGSLLFSTTTPRDLKVASFLLEKGANLGVVARFLERPLEVEHQELLHVFLNNIETISIKGTKIIIAYHKCKGYVEGLSYLAHKLIELTGTDVLFVVVEMAGKIFIIGRSSTTYVDVGRLIHEFGGGGHATAAAAVIKNDNLEKILKTLKNKLHKVVKPNIIAEEIMNQPVKTVLSTTSIKKAAGIMLRYGHTGLPVVVEGKLLGIISRRDVDKALHHGLGHAPVKAFMSKNVKTIARNTSLSEIEDLMIQHDIGRLPVIENNKIVGIVTRSDVLSKIHGEVVKRKKKMECYDLKTSDIKKRMSDFFSARIYDILVSIGNIADNSNVRVYLVGGIVRDLLLGTKNEDLDIVVEGDGIAFAEKVCNYFKGKLRKHKKFGTSTVFLKDNIRIDIVTARREYYPYPAALPEIEWAELKQDLYRRDFTINAMAICLNKNYFGTLIDYFCGYKDLQNKVIRILHNLSFVEDPTRILRAVRFESRLGFTMEEDTESLAYQGVEKLKDVTRQRIGEDFKAILNEDNVILSLKRLQEFDALQYILGDSDIDLDLLTRIENVIRKAKKASINFSPYLLYFVALSVKSKLRYEYLNSIVLNKKERKILEAVKNIEELKMKFINLPDTPGNIHFYLKELESEVCLVVATIIGLDHLIEKVIVYLKKRQAINIKISGEDLNKLGLKPGPVYGEIFDRLKIAQLNGDVNSNKEKQITWVHEYLQRRGR